MQNATWLTAEAAGRLNIARSVGLDTLSPQGTPSTYTIAGTQASADILKLVDFAYPHPGYSNGKAFDRLYITGSDDTVYYVELFDVERGMYGYAFGDGVYWRVAPEFADRLAALFGFETYSSTQRYYDLAEYRTRGGEGSARGEPPVSLESKLPARVVFYAPDHNKTFAEKLRDNDPTHVEISEMGDDCTPAVLATRLKAIKDGGRAIAQVIFACHGAPAMFDGGPKSAPIDSATGIGLYPKNVAPKSFGEMIVDVIDYSGTITLLSCKTAATTVYEGQTLNGTDVVTKLALSAKAWVLASDADVFIYADGTAKTSGTIYACSPKGPYQVYLPPKPMQDYPLYAMPKVSTAAA